MKSEREIDALKRMSKDVLIGALLEAERHAKQEEARAAHLLTLIQTYNRAVMGSNEEFEALEALHELGPGDTDD